MWETMNSIEGVYITNCGRFIPDNEITSWSGNREIPLLSFIAPPLKLHQIWGHINKKKLLSGVTDTCMNTSPRLVWKFSRMCPQTLSIPKYEVFREQNSRKTVSFEEQIMSMNKFTSIFFRQIEAFGVYYPSNIYEARENEWFTNSLPFAAWDAAFSGTTLSKNKHFSSSVTFT